MQWQIDFGADTRAQAESQISASKAPDYVKNFLATALASLPDPEPGHHYHIKSQGNTGNGDI